MSLEKQADKLTKTSSNATVGKKKLCQCHPFTKVEQHGPELSNDPMINSCVGEMARGECLASLLRDAAGETCFSPATLCVLM